jgi:poly(A) polymerase
MTTRLEPQDWMNAPGTAAVLDALARAGAEARFVGGCVRDSLIGRAVKDIDIATDAVPERVIEALEAAGIKAVPTGIGHGTVTAVSRGKPFEITTLRRDVETFGRHARVAFTDDWHADAARRDFTINAMFLARDGALYDPFGGERDLRAGRVRFVGDPRSRIEEDVLRLLRFFRFHAHYGKDPLDAEGLAACRAMAPRLAGLSAERVWSELGKLLAAAAPGNVLRVMHGEGILGVVLPEASALDRLDRLVALETAQSTRWPGVVSADPVRRLGALLVVDGAGADGVARRLRASNAERERLVAIAASIEAPPDLRDDRAARRVRYRMSALSFLDAVLVLWAADEAGSSREEALAVAAGWTPPALPIAGRDASALGVPSGPRIGVLLRAVEDWWIGQDFRPGRKECLARLRAEAGA